MLNQIRYMLAIAVVVATATMSSPHATAGETTISPAVEKKTIKPSRFPFRGKLSAIDLDKKTVSLAGKDRMRIIQITKETRIMRNGMPANLADAVLGEEVGGLLTRDADGQEQAVSLRLGPKSDVTPASETGRQ